MPVTINGSSGVTANDGSVFTNASGNVGIGTTSPVAKLDLRGNHLIATNFNGDNILAFGNTTALGGTLSGAPGSMYGNSFIVGNSTSGSGVPSYLAFWTTANGNAAERMRITSGGDLQFNSGYGSVATAYGCRAWVNFNSSGTIRASGNVSSISVRGTGEYTVNFTTAMPDANYAATFGAQATGSAGPVIVYDDGIAPTTTALAIESGDAASRKGYTYMVVSVFR